MNDRFRSKVILLKLNRIRLRLNAVLSPNTIPPMKKTNHGNGGDHPTDEELMERCANGDQSAFNTIVGRHQTEILNFFRRMGDHNSADDLAQETFLRLFRYRDRYRPTAKLKTFLYLLARRTWIDNCRAKGRRREGYERIVAETELRREVDQPLRDEACSRVRAALDGLSEEMRMVVVMSVYQGFKYREIAELMEIPLGTVKTRMFHAIKKLREILNDEKD